MKTSLFRKGEDEMKKKKKRLFITLMVVGIILVGMGIFMGAKEYVSSKETTSLNEMSSPGPDM